MLPEWRRLLSRWNSKSTWAEKRGGCLVLSYLWICCHLIHSSTFRYLFSSLFIIINNSAMSILAQGLIFLWNRFLKAKLLGQKTFKFKTFQNCPTKMIYWFLFLWECLLPHTITKYEEPFFIFDINIVSISIYLITSEVKHVFMFIDHFSFFCELTVYNLCLYFYWLVCYFLLLHTLFSVYS